MNKNCCGQQEVPLLAKFLYVAGRVETRLEAALAESGLSLAKFALLTHLVNVGEPLSLTRLAERRVCVKSNITQLIDRLEADGLVKRLDDPKDRRSVLAAITEEGRCRYEQGGQALAAAQREVLKSFSSEELELMDRLLGRFVSA
ncbi:MAG: MarR family transcriptional regulator [Candidatus Handelsmanbacteria bacterium]|nr:MarR family transcriptional regulator [Candidatus Handelsmanbacteria bacterium]